MKTRMTMVDYIIAAILAAILGGTLGYLEHRSCQRQAVWAADYLDSDQYRYDRAAHMKLLGGIR